VHIYWVFLSTIICILIVPREWKFGGDGGMGRQGDGGMGRQGDKGTRGQGDGK